VTRDTRQVHQSAPAASFARAAATMRSYFDCIRSHSVCSSRTCAPLSSVDVTASQRVQAVRPGHAVLTDPGSLSIIDFTDPAAAAFSAHHLIRGWNSGMAWDDDDLLVATGPYGLQRFSLARGGEPAPAVP